MQIIKQPQPENQLRQDALAILEAGMQAIQTTQVMREKVALDRHFLRIGDAQIDLRPFNRIFVIGIGKASCEAARVLEKILGDRIFDGITLDVQSEKLTRIESIAGTHPLPSEKNMDATARIVSMLKRADEDDLIISLISGGGSALLCWPYELKCDEMVRLTKALMDSGATIEEINTVRKHVSEIQGGQFAALAAPTQIISLIFSDVPGDKLDMVASGPTILDETTIEDARRVLERYNILESCALPDCNLRETPKDPKLFAHVTNIMVVGNTVAVNAMASEAKKRGYTPRILTTELQGEAKDVGRRLARTVRAKEALIAAGETTVTLTNDGVGGRNQEVALAALEEIDEKTLVLSCASDGIDNTNAAGAIADVLTQKRANEQSLDPSFFLRSHDSYTFFQKTGDHIVTGITGANVSDLLLALKQD